MKKQYLRPDLHIVEFEVERGFADSLKLGNSQQPLPSVGTFSNEEHVIAHMDEVEGSNTWFD